MLIPRTTNVPAPGRAEQLIAGWAQFAADLACYEPPAARAATLLPTAQVRETLPALVFDARGEVIASNVDDFKAAVLSRISSVKTDLVTDQDFADGDADAKWLREVSAGMKQAVGLVRGGMTSVNDVLNILEQLDAVATKTAISIENKVKESKERKRGEIVTGGVNALRAHIASLNQRMGRDYVPLVPADFGGAVKGKRSLDSIQSACSPRAWG